MLQSKLKVREAARTRSRRANRDFRLLWLTLLFVLGLGTAALAQVQASGTLSGHVTDASGASVPNAVVLITEQQTGVATSTATNSSGFYSVTLLKPGLLDSSDGSGLQCGGAEKLDPTSCPSAGAGLPAGSGKRSAAGDGHGRGSAFEYGDNRPGECNIARSLIQLPLNGRNFSQLALLVPGTNGGEVNGTRSTGSGNETARNGANIVADGARATFNTYLIDGLNDNDQLIGTIKVFPNLEDVQEFKVQIGNYDAEYMSGGAVINVTTASGSNQLHGSAFEFIRNSALDTRQYFDAPNTIPPYKQNQFGGSLGGPIRRNKMFFFGDYQGLRIHEAFSAILSEPTAALRSGDFSQFPSVIYDPTTYNAALNTRQPFANNTIPKNRLRLCGARAIGSAAAA